MIDFHILVQHNAANFDLHITHRITVLLGDSGTGKTALCTEIKHRNSKKQSIMPLRVYEMNADDNILNAKNMIYVIDTEDLGYGTDLGIFSRADIVKQNLFVILIGRTGIKRLPIPIGAIHKLINVKGVTKNMPVYPEEMYSLPCKPIFTIVTEDSMSGYKFMSQVHNTVTMCGASKYKQFLDSNNLLVLDSLGFGAYICEFMDKARDYNQPYIMWKSFECFILEEVFNMTCQTDAFNAEEAYTVLLNKVTNGHYSKHTGCCGDACNHCDNSCKHYDAAKILFNKYPQLRQMLQSSDTIDTYMTAKGLSNEQRDLELTRLKSIAEMSGCTIEDIVKDLL